MIAERRAHEPERTCVGCGGKGTQRVLVRLALRDGAVVLDARRTGGRGAWLHPAEECLDRALRRRALGRALRRPGAAVDAGSLRLRLTGSCRND